MMLWMDAKFVCNGIEPILLHRDVADWSNQDLWHQIADKLGQLAGLHFIPRWIPSHLDAASLECPYEEWVHLWNDRIGT